MRRLPLPLALVILSVVIAVVLLALALVPLVTAPWSLVYAIPYLLVPIAVGSVISGLCAALGTAAVLGWLAGAHPRPPRGFELATRADVD